MCGICGQYNIQTKQLIEQSLLKQMTNSISHRGPDDEGYFQSKGYSAGFRRLSIIDLAGGHQPMSDNEKRYWLVFNGEIYNFKELRHELQNLGYSFQTKSDTEVIICGYRAWGDSVLDKLNGMFDFALWDDKEERLLIARDPMGIKCLYYSYQQGSLIFGSEIRPILVALGNKGSISLKGLNLFLRYRYTPAPMTIFENIKKLAPGSCLIADSSGIKIKRWWKYSPILNNSIKTKDIIDKIVSLYEESMKRHLISDVPLGLLLSGGMDSALLLSLMNKSGSDWHTFTVGFGESYKDDELADARKTSLQLGSIHHEVNITKEEFEKSLPQVIYYLEEPIATASIVPMYHICQRASEFVKVALVGQGPDELFGGYTRHLGLGYGKIWRKIPDFIREPLKKAIEGFGFASSESMRRALFSLDINDKLSRYQNVFSIAEESEINCLFHTGALSEISNDDLFDYWNDLIPILNNLDEIGGFQFLEIRSSLPDELLMYADKLSMAHSLELRVPYLDKEIVQFVETIPDNKKTNLFCRKKLHKKAASRFLPSSIINRKKRAFSINVVDKWFSESFESKMKSYFDDNESYMYLYLDKKEVNMLLRKHQKGIGNYYKILFSLVVFEEWLRQN